MNIKPVYTFCSKKKKLHYFLLYHVFNIILKKHIYNAKCSCKKEEAKKTNKKQKLSGDAFIGKNKNILATILSQLNVRMIVLQETNIEELKASESE